MRLLLAALLGSFASAQTTWIVDDTPGPGVHFASLTAAVAAAASGDTLLVAPGHYDPFHVAGKALSILGDGPGTTVIDGPPIVGMILDYVTITAPPVGTTFRLSGVTIRRDLPSFLNRLAVAGGGVSTAGAVVLTDVISEPATTTGLSGGNGLAVTGIAAHASRCVFRGGWFEPSGVWYLVGATGAIVNGAALFVADACLLSGGSPVASVQIAFVAGGNGLTVLDATAHLTRTDLAGGSATALAASSSTGGGIGLRVAGNASVRVSGSAANSIEGGDAVALGGFGGAGIEAMSPATVAGFGAIAVSTGVGYATSGPSIQGNGQVVLGLPPRPVLSLTGSAPSGGDLQATMAVTLGLAAPTVASQLFVLVVDLAPGFAALPGISAEPLLLTGSAGVLFAGLLDGAGQFAVTFVPATQTPEWTNLPLHLQAFAFDPALGIWHGSNAEVRRIR